MKITKEAVAKKIIAYLNRSISVEDLVDWAENSVCEEEYDEQDFDLIKEIVAKIGLADVKEFGLSWDDCYNFLAQVGYKVKVIVSPS